MVILLLRKEAKTSQNMLFYAIIEMEKIDRFLIFTIKPEIMLKIEQTETRILTPPKTAPS